MLKYKDIERRLKNLVEMNNVYDCARPIFLLLGLFGVAATSIYKTDGVYCLENTTYSTLMTAVIAVIYTPWRLIYEINYLYSWSGTPYLRYIVTDIIRFLKMIKLAAHACIPLTVSCLIGHDSFLFFVF